MHITAQCNTRYFFHSWSVFRINSVFPHSFLFSLLQMLPAEYLLCTRLIIKLGGDVKTLGLGQWVARSHLSFCVFVFNAGKISPVDFLPCWLHRTDGFQYVIVWLTCQLCDLDGCHSLYVVIYWCWSVQRPTSNKFCFSKNYYIYNNVRAILFYYYIFIKIE